MAKTFYPKMHLMVPASPPHPVNTEYKVSIGHEMWDGQLNKVIKIQMVYDGVIAGRRSPSYPLESDDYYRVNEAVEKLHAEITRATVEVW